MTSLGSRVGGWTEIAQGLHILDAEKKTYPGEIQRHLIDWPVGIVLARLA